MRLAVLYARSRGMPATGLVLLALCGTGAQAGHWLGSRPTLDPGTARLPAAAHGLVPLLRNTAGLLGLALFAAAVVGPRLAWLLPLGYAATVYLSARLGDSGGRSVWAFVMQPAGSAPALGSALLLLTAGTAGWAATARQPMR